MTSLIPKLVQLTLLAQQKGADDADAVGVESQSLSVAVRKGEVEKMERSENADIGLRVFIGKKQAMVSSADHSEQALEELATRAVAMAGEVPEDPYCGLADAKQLTMQTPDIDSFDEHEPTAEDLTIKAKIAEGTALGVEGVSNSEGAEAAWGRSTTALVATNGFAKSYQHSSSSLSVSVLAGEGAGNMESDYDFTSAVYYSDLRSAEEVGQVAGMRVVKRLGAQKVGTGKMPIVFAPRVARGLLMHLTGAINGASIARGTSFLKDDLGKMIFPKGFNIVDDPHRQRGLRSRPCDGEGLATVKRNLIEDGKLTTWIMDLRSARQLGLESTGHASRGTSSPPSPSVSNVYLEAGEPTPAELISDIKTGLYVTDLFGQGVNGVTGDYSRGAAGFLIENGEIKHSVAEVTIASNLRDMYANISAANDLRFQYGIDSPTLRVEDMTVAGQ